MTDANLLLGALSSDTLLAGTLRLDEVAARAAVECTGAALGLDALQTAAGVIRIVNTQMAVDSASHYRSRGRIPAHSRSSLSVAQDLCMLQRWPGP